MVLDVLFGQKDILGIDIGTYSIKGIQLKNVGGKWSLVRWFIIPEPEEVQIGEINPNEKKKIISDILRNYLSENKIKIRNVVTSVSGSSVIVRYVKFPKMTKEELSKNIYFEAEPYIPFDIREVNLGFYILGDIVEEGQKKTETVLVAAKKSIIQDKIDILTQAGLQPVIIDVDAFALESCYEVNHDPLQNEIVIILNIGANITNMSIIENGVSKVVRDIFIGGSSFTKALQKNLNCTYKNAEDLKRKYPLLVTSEDKEKALAENNREMLQVSNILIEICHDLLSELHRSIDFFYSQRGEQQVLNRIIISGGGACLKNIDKYFSQELKIPTEICNPLSRISNSEVVPEDVLPILSIATGLAVRRMRDIK